MGPASLFLKDPSGSRFVAGGLAELEALLGAPLPLLPPPERDGHRDVFFVNVQPKLRSQLRRHLLALFSQIGVSAPDSRVDPMREQSEYEQALSRILRSVRASDRRQGLLNLFWLAHSKDVAEYLRELEAKQPAVRKAKYSLHPILSSTYKRLDQEGRKEKNGRVLGMENPGLIESIIEDGFAFTETSSTELDFTSFLRDNKRYRLPAEVFFEIQQVLVRETERRLREGDRGLLTRAARHLPGLPRDQYLKPQSLIKIMMNAHVLPYLLGDPWTTGSRLLASPPIKAEAERRKPAEIVDAFLDVITGAKRFEIVSQVRDRVELIGAFGRELDLEDKASRNQRIYEFGEAAQVLNSAVSATVLFLDLRGFTQTSEGQISERDLTRELYAVFDEFVPLVRRFGGTVDKYLGDGMMVTFGTDRADPLDALNAVRTAILCQDSLRQKRKEGKTYFQMGVAIHFGRVYLARFIEDEENVQSTVIGRNVNLAGRLSSAAKKPLEEDEADTPPPPGPAHASGLRVVVDGAGTLFNEGIAISRDTLVQLESHLALIHGEGVMEYEDESIDKRILIRYAGDAKFKGVRSSLPVYEVDYEGAVVKRIFTPWRHAYVTEGARAPGCVLCRAQERGEAEKLVAHVGERNFVVMNLFPYNAGHVMVAPRRHLGSLTDATPEELAEMMALARRLEGIFQDLYKPDGINVGMNLGRAAGAGVADHIHLHLVPRWNGDTNFISVVGDTRVIPEDPVAACARLRERFRA